MKILCSYFLPLLLLGVLPLGGMATEYSRQPILAAPVIVKDDSACEVLLSTPVSRRHDMVQLDIVFSTDAGARYTFRKDGISSARGSVNLVVTLVGDNREQYSADIVMGNFHDGGVLPKFVTLPPRKVPLRKMILRGINVPPIKQIYWVEGREKLSSSGVDEDLSHCGDGNCRWREAMDYCRSRGGRLLTLDELKIMYADECVGRDREECRVKYWSSTEYALFPRKAWYVDFNDGKAVSESKINIAYVRCIVPAGAVYKSKK